MLMLLLAGAVAVGVLSLAHTAPFAFLLEAFHRKESAWHMPSTPNSPVVYLTYDDGPNPTATPLLLDVLRRENVHATFFLIDDHLNEETGPIVQRMFAEGHAVGLHSNKRWLMLRSAEDIVETLEQTAQRVEQLGGSRPCRWFRPHAGWRSGTLYEALERADYRLAGWSFGLWDWNWRRSREADALADRLARRAHAGDIIVIHDGHHIDPRADRQYAVDATARLIPLLRARQVGFEPFPCE
jgi:peptidoglycan/xylan/chitin deacetylase (PgdA/CDA1 family)